jgi:hypothetical protein
LSTTLGKRILALCGGVTFVACFSVLVVYAVHGWAWDSKFAGGRITLTLPEFVIAIVLITLVFGIFIDIRRNGWHS